MDLFRSQLPAGLGINASGVISGMVTATSGAYSVKITAADGQGGSQPDLYLAHLDVVADQSGHAKHADGDAVSLPLKASGWPSGPGLDLWGDWLAKSLTINSITGVISGTVTDAANSYPVTVSASDGLGASVSQSVSTWVVLTLSLANPGTQNNADGDAVSLTVQARNLPSGDSWSYAATGLPPA